MGVFKLGKMTLKSMFIKPETIQYPQQQKTPPAGLKGHIVNQVEACILCGICAKRCPCDAIAVEKAQRLWCIDRFRCVQCGSCVRECPKQCLLMDPRYAACAVEKKIETFSVPQQPKKAAS